jgi:hypothetical protein
MAEPTLIRIWLLVSNMHLTPAKFKTLRGSPVSFDACELQIRDFFKAQEASLWQKVYLVLFGLKKTSAIFKA